MGEYSIGDAIQQFLEQSRVKGYIQALQVEDAWEQIMGKTIAKYTDDIKIINDTLFITTHVAPLKQELVFQKEKNKASRERSFREKCDQRDNNQVSTPNLLSLPTTASKISILLFTASSMMSSDDTIPRKEWISKTGK
jgi:hypothetical protein